MTTITTLRHDTLSIATWRHDTLPLATWLYDTFSIAKLRHDTLSIATWRHDNFSIATLLHHFHCYHGNTLVTMVTGNLGFGPFSTWTVFTHFLSFKGIFEGWKQLFHYHGNGCQGNHTSVFFLLSGSHDPPLCKVSSRSEQKWRKNNVKDNHTICITV